MDLFSDLLFLQEVKKYLLECIQIFSFEPPCLQVQKLLTYLVIYQMNFQEGRLATIARLDLLELETFLDSMDKA